MWYKSWSSWSNYFYVPLKLKKGTLLGSEISLNVIEAEPVRFDSMVNCGNRVGDLFADLFSWWYQPDIGGVTIYIVTPTKEPDEVIQSSDSDSDDSDTEVPVVRGLGSYGLRPNPTKTQV